jgi:carbon storage regulator
MRLAPRPSGSGTGSRRLWSFDEAGDTGTSGTGRANLAANMFIIARHRGQRIEIGDEIVVTVTEISRSSVKLGIIAPRNCPIVRGELRESVELANREAVQSNISIGTQTTLDGETDSQTTEAVVTDTETFLRASVKTLASVDVSEATGETVAAK